MTAHYHYRFPALELLIAVWILYFGSFGIGIFFNASDAIATFSSICGPGLIVVTIACAIWIIPMGTWESRVDGTVISFRSPNGCGWVTVNSSDLQTVNIVTYPNEEHLREYELLQCDGSRLHTGVLTIGGFDSFKNAVLRSNPNVRFAYRNGSICFQCGADLRTRRDHCPKCGQTVPGGEGAANDPAPRPQS